jgi:hypothetical protein
MMLLGVGYLFEFTSIEKDAPAILTLLDVDTTSVKRRHAALALGADHTASLDEARPTVAASACHLLPLGALPHRWSRAPQTGRPTPKMAVDMGSG